MNIARFYVRAYRWLLLLLVALVIEKCLDALTIKVVGQIPFYPDVVVSLPSLTGGIHWRYIFGILQIFVTLMLLLRYSLSLIEFITERCRPGPKADIQMKYLAEVGALPVLFTLILTVFEFLFILQAAVAIPSVRQWLAFLVYLSSVDLLAIWFLPYAVRFALSAAIKILKWFHGGRTAASIFVAVTRSVEQSTSSTKAENTITYTVPDWLIRYRDELTNAINEWSHFKYHWWTSADLVVALVGFIFATIDRELAVVVGVFVATVALSAWNLRCNHTLYEQHIKILTKA